MFDQGKYRWAFLFFLTNILAITPVFSNESGRLGQKGKESKAKINPKTFKAKDFVWDIKNPSQEFLQAMMKKALKKLNPKRKEKIAQFNWLKCPVKGYLARIGNRSAIYLDGKKAVEIPVKSGESYEKIAEKIYSVCGVTAEKTVLGMLSKNIKSDTAIPGLIKKMFEGKNLKKGKEENKKKESAQKEDAKQKEGAKNKEDVKNKGKAAQTKQKFAPKITLSKFEKNTLSIDGKEIQCFTCTKNTVRGATKRRLVGKNQESLFGFMFKNEKDKWVYYMELFGGKKGDLITEHGWKAKYENLIKKHDGDSSLKEQTTWCTKGDADDKDSNKNEYRTNLSDAFILNPMETDQIQSSDFFKTAKFNDRTTD